MRKNIFFIILCLFTFFKSTQPAKAEFVTAWIIAGIVIGITVAELNHQSNEAKE